MASCPFFPAFIISLCVPSCLQDKTSPWQDEPWLDRFRYPDVPNYKECHIETDGCSEKKCQVKVSHNGWLQ